MGFNRAVPSLPAAPVYSNGEQGSYSSQYAQLYFVRLAALKPILEKVVKDRYPDIPLLSTLSELPSPSKRCVVIGTVFKSMPRRPSALSEYLDMPLFDPKQQHLFNNSSDDREEVMDSFVSAEDSVSIEDQFARVNLSMEKAAIDRLCHGLVAAFVGVMDNTFLVQDIVFPGVAPQKPISDSNLAGKALFISGLNLGSPEMDATRVSVLIDFLSGFMSNDGDLELSSSISHLVIAGNLMNVSYSKTLDSIALSHHSKYMNQKLQKSREELKDSILLADSILSQLCASMNVILIPGENDPTSTCLPQIPIVKHVLPKTSGFSSFRSLSNPETLEIDGIPVCITAGQSLRDITRYSSNTIMEASKLVVSSRILAPTCPDTLPCMPYNDQDPFIIRESPRLLVFGNQNTLEMDSIQEGDTTVHLLSLPDFSKTGLTTIVDLQTMEMSPVQIDI